MENFELIDKFIGGHLNDLEKQEFEQQLLSDPVLQNDVAFQKQIVEGIKKARISEIKAMLNQVPVGGAVQLGLATGKIITGIIAVGTITASLLYFKPWETTLPPNEKLEIPKAKSKKEDPSLNLGKAIIAPKENKITLTPIESKAKKEVSIPKSRAVQPKIEVIDPTEEINNSDVKAKSHSDNARAHVEASHIAVETNSSNSKYPFHYQFKEGKLILYGNFDKDLYEILEVHGDSHAVFLFFGGNYYSLKDKQSTILPLIVISDPQLIKKLNEYRSR